MLNLSARSTLEETCAKDGKQKLCHNPSKGRIEIDLERLSNLLHKRGFPIKSMGMFGITFEKSSDVTVCFLRRGTMVAQASSRANRSLER